MIGKWRQAELQLLVLRDGDEVAGALRRALAEADERERPGLERALAIAEAAASVPDDELRARWVHRRLAAAGHEGPADSVAAIKALRESAPGLSLAEAVRLAKAASARGDAPDAG